MTPAAIDEMVTGGTFSIPELSIHLPNQSCTVNITLSFPSPTKLERDKTFSISGFPRQLVIEK